MLGVSGVRERPMVKDLSLDSIFYMYLSTDGVWGLGKFHDISRSGLLPPSFAEGVFTLWLYYLRMTFSNNMTHLESQARINP